MATFYATQPPSGLLTDDNAQELFFSPSRRNTNATSRIQLEQFTPPPPRYEFAEERDWDFCVHREQFRRTVVRVNTRPSAHDARLNRHQPTCWDPPPYRKRSQPATSWDRPTARSRSERRDFHQHTIGTRVPQARPRQPSSWDHPAARKSTIVEQNFHGHRQPQATSLPRVRQPPDPKIREELHSIRVECRSILQSLKSLVQSLQAEQSNRASDLSAGALMDVQLEAKNPSEIFDNETEISSDGGDVSSKETEEEVAMEEVKEEKCVRKNAAISVLEEEATTTSQELRLTIASANLADVVSEASNSSTELAAEALERAAQPRMFEELSDIVDAKKLVAAIKTKKIGKALIGGDVATSPLIFFNQLRQIEHVYHARKSSELAVKATFKSAQGSSIEAYDYLQHFYSRIFAPSWQFYGAMVNSSFCVFDPGGSFSMFVTSHLEDKVDFNRGGVDTSISRIL